jgi:hypothetical protein
VDKEFTLQVCGQLVVAEVEQEPLVAVLLQDQPQLQVQVQELVVQV